MGEGVHAVSFHVKVVLGVAALVAAALGLIFLLRDSDEEAIEKLLKDGAAAATKQDADAVIALLSKNFKSPEGDHAWAAGRIRRLLSQGMGQIEASPGGITVQGEEASARVGIRARAGPYGTGTQVDFRFRKESGAWKVTSAEEVR